MKRGELDDLAAFAIIAQTRSFTRAAAELGLTPSALSHSIRLLEERLGVQLLARTTRSVAPTAAGDRLLASLTPAFKSLETGLAAFRESSGKTSGPIRITAAQFTAQTVLAPALPKFLEANPDITVEVNVDSRLVDLVREGFDAGIRWGDKVERDMVAVRVGPDSRMIVVAAPVYLARYPPPQTPADLEAHNCVNYRLPTSGGVYPWALRRGDEEVRGRAGGQLVLDDPDLALGLIVEGVGLGLVIEEKATPHLASGRLVHLLAEWSVPLGRPHLYYPSRHVSPALRALIDALKWRGSEPLPSGSKALNLPERSSA